MPNDTIRLRAVEAGDLPVFFAQQLDPQANWLAAFVTEQPGDRARFDARWARALADPTIVVRAVLAGGALAGHILSYEQDGKPEVTYWLGRAFWGRGIASAALRLFLREFDRRPLYARVASRNAASRRILEKCGFVAVGTGHDYAPGRGELIEETILRLDTLDTMA